MRSRLSDLLLLSLFVTAAACTQSSVSREGILDANLADQVTLRSLPHLTDAISKAIVSARPFTSVTALDELLAGSLSESQRADLYRRFFRQINLNTASRAEIMLIPGISEKLAHEFEEYRPYTSMEQFRREI